MKILLIIDDYMPDSIKVGAKMMHELACEFHKQGHSVTVVTPSSKLKVKTDISTLDGITVCRFKNGEIKNVGKIKRAINETFLSFNAWRSFKSFFKNNKHDLIVYYSPTIFWGGLVQNLKKLWSVPSYLILRDLFPQWTIDQGMIGQDSLIAKYFRFFEKKSYMYADTIGLMSEKNLQYFNLTMSRDKELRVLYNWASNTVTKKSEVYRKKLNLEGKVVYFYGGNMGHAQDMMNIMRLVIKMKKIELAHFVLVGEGDEVALIKKVIKEKKLYNITLLPPVSQEVYKDMLSEFDIGLFSLHKSHTAHNFPGKLLGYMVGSIPILGSINQGNDLKNILEDVGAGLLSINGRDELFFQNAVLLLDLKLREEMGLKGYKLLNEQFSVESAVKNILEA